MAEGGVASFGLSALAIPRLGRGGHNQQREQTEKRNQNEAMGGGNGERTRRALRGGGYMFMIRVVEV
jgi:hypothetical protein